jgi:hypothetical protein
LETPLANQKRPTNPSTISVPGSSSRTTNPKVVSERLGHGNPAFTIDTYQHVLPGMQAEVARIFEKLIAGRR